MSAAIAHRHIRAKKLVTALLSTGLDTQPPLDRGTLCRCRQTATLVPDSPYFITMLNFFKRKQTPAAPVAPTVKTVLCVPGPWQSHQEVLHAIAENNLNEYIFAGMLLFDMKRNIGYELEICDPDTRMRQSFEVAGSTTGVCDEEAFLDAIEAHQTVLYVVGETGSLQAAEQIARAGAALLKAGGIGLKVESAGKAFTKAQWLDMLENDFNEASLYKMFVLDVLLDSGRGILYSCGMHNLGLKDALFADGQDRAAIMDTLSSFGYYQIVDKPTIHAGQTFSPYHDAPVYRIHEEHDQPNAGHDLFENPFGMWRFEKIRD